MLVLELLGMVSVPGPVQLLLVPGPESHGRGYKVLCICLLLVLDLKVPGSS